MTKTLIIDSLKDPRHKTGKVQTLKTTRCEDNHSSVVMRFFPQYNYVVMKHSTNLCIYTITPLSVNAEL